MTASARNGRGQVKSGSRAGHSESIGKPSGAARQARVAGHFGEWLQGLLGPDGPVALVTLPCSALAVRVRWSPAATLRIGGSDACVLPRTAALRLLHALDLPAAGEVTVAADMPPGGGAGASTAALLALAAAAGTGGIAPDRLAAACVRAEGASDPLMLDAPDTHLWASREGRSLVLLPAPPAFDVIGGFFGPSERTDPRDRRLPDISDLIDPWRRAAQDGDRRTLATLAATSAERTTALRGPAGDPTAALARACGALGHVRAHTGSARGLLFAPGSAPAEVEVRLRAAGFRRILRFATRP